VPGTCPAIPGLVAHQSHHPGAPCFFPLVHRKFHTVIPHLSCSCSGLWLQSSRSSTSSLHCPLLTLSTRYVAAVRFQLSRSATSRRQLRRGVGISLQVRKADLGECPAASKSPPETRHGRYDRIICSRWGRGPGVVLLASLVPCSCKSADPSSCSLQLHRTLQTPPCLPNPFSKPMARPF
jgi:hypothetical protein